MDGIAPAQSLARLLSGISVSLDTARIATGGKLFNSFEEIIHTYVLD